MLYSVNKKQFTESALINRHYILTDCIRDMNNFEGKFFCDETDTYYSSVNYGSSSDTITIFNCYSEEALERAKEYFPNAAGYCFICAYEDYHENDIHANHGISYHYKYIGVNSADSKSNEADIRIKKIDADSFSVLEEYDEAYMSFLRKNHGARLANLWKNNEARMNEEKQAIYIAYLEDAMIGFVLMDHYTEYNACDVSQITIEEKYQRNGFGTKLLNLIVREMTACGYNNIFYSSVEGDNIASQRTAEHCGFEKVACKIGIL